MIHLLARPTALPFGLSLCNLVRPKAEFLGDATCAACLSAAQRASTPAATPAATPARAPSASAPASAPLKVPSVALRPLGAAPVATPAAAPSLSLRPLGAAPVATPVATPAVAAVAAVAPVVLEIPAPAEAEMEEDEDLDLDFEALQAHYAVLKRIESTLPEGDATALEAFAALDVETTPDEAPLHAAVQGALLALGLPRISLQLARLRHPETDEAPSDEAEGASTASDAASDAQPDAEPDAGVADGSEAPSTEAADVAPEAPAEGTPAAVAPAMEPKTNKGPKRDRAASAR